ncbi:MAG TPA: type II secretion system protein GspN [Myxococcota bacterium]|nr:type II secretion system protein GspN [Myxococcota bacterium]HQK51641.1 type II secretion system protein GspN [Myxococcota bacterium]
MVWEWLRRPAVARGLRIGGFVAFALAVFLAVLTVSFPAARLKRWLEGQASARGFPTRIEEVSLRPLGGVVLQGVRVDLPPQRDSLPDGTVVETPRSLALDRVDVSFGIFRALFGSLKVQVVIRSGEGRLGPIQVVRTSDQIRVALEGAQDFPLPSTLPIFGIRMAGVLKALKGTLTYDQKGGWAESRGRLEVRAEGLRALRPVLRSATQGSVTLSDASLGTLDVVINLDRRQDIPAFKGDKKGAPGNDGTVLHVEKAELDGEDVKALFEGHSLVRLAPGKPIRDGQLQAEIAFSLSDAFFDRTVREGTGDPSTPNRFLRTLLNMDPKWRAAQSGNYWGVLCTGTLGRPACIPKRPIVRGGDFKPPEKAQEKPAESPSPTTGRPSTPVREAPPASPTPPPSPVPATASPAPVAPPPRVEPTIAPPPAPEAARVPAIEAPAGPVASPSAEAAAASAVRESGALKPVILGRARIRGMVPPGDEEEVPGPAGEAPPPPQPPPVEGQE